MSDTLGETVVDELVRRAQRRDSLAFTELIRRYERTCLALARAGVGEAHAAGDVVQEALVRAWERLSTLNDPARFGPWLANIVRNLAADARRRGKRMRGGEEIARAEGVEARGSGPVELMGRDEAKRAIDEALAGLDELSRSAVVLRYYEGMSSKEIGVLLGMSPAAIDMRLMRAREQLRRQLSQMQELVEPAASLIQSRMGGAI